MANVAVPDNKLLVGSDDASTAGDAPKSEPHLSVLKNAMNHIERKVHPRGKK